MSNQSAKIIKGHILKMNPAFSTMALYKTLKKEIFT